MGKLTITIETEYEVGDVVVFKKDDRLLTGIIDGYYADQNANNSLWFNIRVNRDYIYTYSNGGDVSESDIICKLPENEAKKVYDVILGEDDQFQRIWKNTIKEMKRRNIKEYFE